MGFSMGQRKEHCFWGVPQVVRRSDFFEPEKPSGIKGIPEKAVNHGENPPSSRYFTTARSPYYPALLSVYE
jgi:hypothetical protein